MSNSLASEYNIHGLEVLKSQVDKFIEDYSRELSDMLHKATTVKIKKYYVFEPVLMLRMMGGDLKCNILSETDYSDEVKGEI